MLEIKHLSYQVEGESGEELGILNDVSLTVADHQFVVITGPNGGGKTTLAKAIMGLVRPTGGTIAWNGTDITGLDITQRARLGVSYGFQQPPRFKGLRVRDLLALAAGSEKPMDARPKDRNRRCSSRMANACATWISWWPTSAVMQQGNKTFSDIFWMNRWQGPKSWPYSSFFKVWHASSHCEKSGTDAKSFWPSFTRRTFRSQHTDASSSRTL